MVGCSSVNISITSDTSSIRGYYKIPGHCNGNVLETTAGLGVIRPRRPGTFDRCSRISTLPVHSGCSVHPPITILFDATGVPRSVYALLERPASQTNYEIRVSKTLGSPLRSLRRRVEFHISP